jgi:V/A-type H+-transporting ATPase subunit K
MSLIKKKFRQKVFWSIAILLIAFFMTGIPVVTKAIGQTNESASGGANTEKTNVAAQTATGGNALGLIAAGLAFGLGALGAGIAIGNIGAAAMGAISEKPEIAGNALIFIALAEGLMVFGFIIAFIILGKV